MARILRGDIVWADLNPVKGREQAGLRPVLILSHDVFNERSGTVIALALTSQPQRAGFPLTLELDAKVLPKKSWVKIGQIRTLSSTRPAIREHMRQLREEIQVVKDRYGLESAVISNRRRISTKPATCEPMGRYLRTNRPPLTVKSTRSFLSWTR
jgi:mRNA interferase MazF